MAKLLKLRRGTTTQHSSFTGAEGEVTVDTDKETLVVHDGSTAGGHPVAAEDMANVSSASIAGRLGTDSIAVSKIAAGTLPADVKIDTANINNSQVTSGKIATGTIVNGNISGSAAIAGTKISPDFGSQNVVTTGTLGSGDLTITGGQPSLKLVDDGANPDYNLYNNNGTLRLYDITNNADRLVVNTDGHVDVTGNLDVGAGVDVTGNITVSGTVDGRDVAADGTKLDGIESGATADQTSTEIKSLLASDNLTASHLAANSVGASELANNAVDTSIIQNNAVTYAKMGDIAANRLMGRISSGSGDPETLTAANVRTIINVEDGATADQSASEIVSLVSGQNITPTTVYTNSDSGKIGRDSTDYISFANNSYMDIHINGSNEFRFEADGDFHADGDVIAQSTTTASDRRLKENIEPVSDALKKVQALNGVSFDWKKTGEKSAGVIAQEVIGVLPEAVKEVTPVGGGESHLAVNYHALTSILIEAIKELKAELDEHKGGK